MSQKAGGAKPAQQSGISAHQTGQEVFKAILSEDIDWKPFPAFPPAVRPARRRRRSALGARPLHHQGQSASRRETDAS